MKPNLPVDISNIGENVGTMVDGIVQAPVRYKNAVLDTQAKELDITLTEQWAQLEAEKQRIEIERDKLALESQKQKAQLEAEKQRIEIERDKLALESQKQKAQLEAEKQRIEIERGRLAFQKERQECDIQIINYAMDIANKMINELNPNVNEQIRARLIKQMIPGLLQLWSKEPLYLVLAEPKALESSDY